MLTKGDLVRVRQSTHLHAISPESWSHMILKEPTIAIILRQKGEKCEVLLRNEVYEVDTKKLTLFEVTNVR